MRLLSLSFASLLLLSCGTGTGTPDADTDVPLVNGCPSLMAPVAQPGGPAEGDTWATFAQGFFATNCTRCHSSQLMDSTARSGAPPMLNWDVEATVRANLMLIRRSVGVTNFMPLGMPGITCDQRRRLVRWIDVGAP